MMQAAEFRSAPEVALELPDVTLLAASSTAIGPTLRALRLSMKGVRFGAIKFLTDALPDSPAWEGIEAIPIARIKSRRDYSDLMLRHLACHVDTGFVLCVQWDGYVLNPQSWDPKFLDFDYVGAPWPHFQDGMSVGNGGFSLRSRRLLAACQSASFPEGMDEDVAICRAGRRELEESFGIRFADAALAARFSYERTESRGDEFGFHGVFNLPQQMDRREFLRLYSSLERTMHCRSEAIELAKWGIRHGDVALAALATLKACTAKK